MATRMNQRYVPDPSTGGMLDTVTGQVIREGDPGWQPEWSQVLATIRATPAGQHWQFDNGYNGAPGDDLSVAGLEKAGGKLVDNNPPWYEDPALLGAIAMPAAAGVLGAFSSAAGAAGDLTGEATLTSTPITGVGSTAPGTIASAAGGSGAAGTSVSDATGILGKVGNLLKAGGQGIGGAANAAMNNDLEKTRLGLDANQQNISGEQAFINEQLAMAKEEAAQRSNAMRDVYRANFAANPTVSPFDPVGAPKLSPQYMSTVTNLGNQGSNLMNVAPKYNVAGMTPPTPYKPINPSDVMGATGNNPGLLTKIGNWAGPAASIGGTILKMF